LLAGDTQRSHVHRFSLQVESPAGSAELPVILVRGARAGRTLVVTAGVHGDEYEGIQAIFDAVRDLDPSQMTGDLLALTVCHPDAFWNVSRSSPKDQGNLARVFPGRLDGTLTEAIAWQIDREILQQADFYLDLHAGGVKLRMPPLVGFHAPDRRSREAALIFGVPWLWEHTSIAPGRTISSALARGIPFLYAEVPGGGAVDPAHAALYSNGIRNLLRYLDILPRGELRRVPVEGVLLGDGNVDESLSAAHSGFLVSDVRLLQRVRMGDRLGVLLDLHGCELEQYTAPRQGVVAMLRACPVVHASDPLFLIAETRELEC
jgi:predicted deacylase